MATTVGELLAEWRPADIAATWQGRALALLVLALFSAVQLLGVRAGGASQELLSLVKAVAFLGLAAASFVLPPVVPAVSTAADPADPLQQGPAVAIGAVLALQAVITTFDGWASPVYFAEEFSDPSRDLPRSLIGGVLAVLALYLLINAALLHVLPIEVLSEANLPAADAARSVLGQPGGQVISAVALISLLGLINTVVMAAPRILFGLSRDQLMPAALSGVNQGGTPTAALLLTSGCAALLVLAGSFDHLLGMGAFLYVALPLSGIAAQLWLRRQQPELPRPFLSWGYPLTPWLVGSGSLAFLIGAMVSDTADSLLALALVGAGGIAGESWQRLQPKAGS